MQHLIGLQAVQHNPHGHHQPQKHLWLMMALICADKRCTIWHTHHIGCRQCKGNRCSLNAPPHACTMMILRSGQRRRRQQSGPVRAHVRMAGGKHNSASLKRILAASSVFRSAHSKCVHCSKCQAVSNRHESPTRNQPSDRLISAKCRTVP